MSLIKDRAEIERNRGKETEQVEWKGGWNVTNDTIQVHCESLLGVESVSFQGWDERSIYKRSSFGESSGLDEKDTFVTPFLSVFREQEESIAWTYRPRCSEKGSRSLQDLEDLIRSPKCIIRIIKFIHEIKKKNNNNNNNNNKRGSLIRGKTTFSDPPCAGACNIN